MRIKRAVIHGLLIALGLSWISASAVSATKVYADGSSFESAFESEYSLPWGEAAPIVTRIVSKAVTAARK